MKAVYTERHRSHDPQFFLVRGVVRRTTEQPERADRLLKGLAAGSHDLVEPTVFGQGPRARIHSPEYLRFLAEAWEEWTALGDAGPEMIASIHPVRQAATYPTSIVGKLGWHTADTGCPIGPGTWAGACAATDVAVTAAQLVMDGEDASYALCRPPGHHAYHDMAGGFCFLNNSAIAAAHLRLRHERVAILDVDVHHGNGTQGIFYSRADVLTVSIHADPKYYYPFVWGYAHERGEGAGLGANFNIPLPIGTGDDAYLQALDSARKTIEAFAAGALIVALGLDASEHDPPSKGFRLQLAVSAALAPPSRAWACRRYSSRRADIYPMCLAIISPPSSVDFREPVRWPMHQRAHSASRWPGSARLESKSLKRWIRASMD